MPCYQFCNIFTIIFITLFLLVFKTQLTFSQGPIRYIEAVLNGTASLPCDIKPQSSDDYVILVVWYRNELKPIYSYDIRENSNKVASHWTDKNGFGDRAYFRTVSEPALLIVKAIEEYDAGYYRCRVDFIRSPTRNSKVHLSVIVPPEKPLILSEDGREMGTSVGPYEELSSVKFICQVQGGKPSPIVTWWSNGILLESLDVQSIDENIKIKELSITNLTRSNLFQSYTCLASNNEISPPATSTITLDLHFSPMNVSILESDQPLSANKKYNLTCQSIGSRPHANITWWKNGYPLNNYTQQVSNDGNFTTSTLIFQPTLRDHNHTLTCRAENSHLHNGTKETSWLIDVTFAPELRLDLGANMNAEDIEEGDDVYFECKVASNPPAYKVEWTHNGGYIHHNAKDGIIVSGTALILQGVKRRMAGNYTCCASSVEGDGRSNVVYLSIMYKPVCKPNQKYIYGVAKEENAYVICEVDAFPLPNLFTWLFNHTTRPIPDARYTAVDNRRGLSILTFSPHSELDYGILLCWATNSVGLQKEPCVFHIIPAGQPETPKDCTINNKTSESVEIICKEGFDGGQNQYFIAEVLDSQHDKLLTNLSSNRLYFKIDRLKPLTYLTINIYAANGRGKSEAAIVDVATLDSAQKRTGNPDTEYYTPVISGICLLMAVAFILVILINILRSKCKSSSTINNKKSLNDKQRYLKDHDDDQDIYEVGEKTPDVIQCNNKGSDFIHVKNDIEHDEQNSTIIRNTENYQNYNINFNSDKIINVPANDIRDSNSLVGKKFSSIINGESDYVGKPRTSPTTVTSVPPSYREVITIKTPLLLNQQESCV